MKQAVRHFRGGWTLTFRYESSFLMTPAVPVIVLSGLVITPEQADVLLAARPSGRVSYGQHDGLACARVNQIELTPAEAVRIRDGEHPLNVLLPPLYLRPLSLEELMSR